MKNLKETFEKEFQLNFDALFVLPENLMPIDPDRGEDNYFYYLPVDNNDHAPYLAQGEIDIFLDEAPLGYFQIGFWGHGVNSYAFYYCQVTEWSKIFFRLPYGGVYMNNEEEAKRFRNFLPAYFNFIDRISGKVESLVAIDSMGGGSYEVKVKDRPLIEFRESFFTVCLIEDRFTDFLYTIEKAN